MAARCEKYDLPAEMCAHCTGAEERARVEERQVIVPGSPWFQASYFGKCSGCGEPVKPGARIRSDGTGGYLCGRCGAASDLEGVV